MRSRLNRLPDDDRHHCKYREDRDEARAEVERLRDGVERWRTAHRNANAELEGVLAERDRYREALQAAAELKCRSYPDYDYDCRTRGDVPREQWCAPCLARAALGGVQRQEQRQQRRWEGQRQPPATGWAKRGRWDK